MHPWLKKASSVVVALVVVSGAVWYWLSHPNSTPVDALVNAVVPGTERRVPLQPNDIAALGDGSALVTGSTDPPRPH